MCIESYDMSQNNFNGPLIPGRPFNLYDCKQIKNMCEVSMTRRSCYDKPTQQRQDSLYMISVKNKICQIWFQSEERTVLSFQEYIFPHSPNFYIHLYVEDRTTRKPCAPSQHSPSAADIISTARLSAFKPLIRVLIAVSQPSISCPFLGTQAMLARSHRLGQIKVVSHLLDDDMSLRLIHGNDG